MKKLILGMVFLFGMSFGVNANTSFENMDCTIGLINKYEAQTGIDASADIVALFDAYCDGQITL